MGSIWSPCIPHMYVDIGSIQDSLVGHEVNNFPSVQLLLTCKQSAYMLYIHVCVWYLSRKRHFGVFRKHRSEACGRRLCLVQTILGFYFKFHVKWIHEIGGIVFKCLIITRHSRLPQASEWCFRKTPKCRFLLKHIYSVVTSESNWAT